MAVGAGVYIADGAKRLGLKISPKSAVLFNRPGVAKIVADLLREAGVDIKASTITKDLGVGTTAGGQRRTRTQQLRRAQMGKRLAKIRGLVKQSKRCRVMVWVGAKPQGTWGHQGIGLAPTSVRHLRQQFAGAAMIRKVGGCTTTAFAITVGLEKDPTIGIRHELFNSWLELVLNPSIPKQGLAKVWDQMRGNLAGPLRWQQVRGPMGAVVAILYDLGWQPAEPTKWTDPDGVMWDVDPRAPGVRHQLQDMMSELIEASLWRKASLHYCGKGLEHGADLTVARRKRQHLIRAGEFHMVGMLEMIVQGVGWPPARKAAAGMPVDPVCPFCKAAAGTVLHQAWQCPALLQAIGPARAAGEHMEATALRDSRPDERASWQAGLPPPAHEAFWCRGLPPQPRALNLLLEPPCQTQWFGTAVQGSVLRLPDT